MYLILAITQQLAETIPSCDTKVRECEDGRCHTPFIFLFHSGYYHCFVVFFPLFLVSFLFLFGLCCRHHGITAPDVIGLALQSSVRRTLRP